jgi:hypothetical protein
LFSLCFLFSSITINHSQPGKIAVSETSTECTLCIQGTYMDEIASKVNCIQCSPGTSQPSSGQQNCQDCSPGFYSNTDGSSECKNCPVNTYAETPAHDQVCVDCPIGYEASIQSSSCTLCPAGKAGTPCVGCLVGQFRGSNDLPTSCIDCPSGFYQGAEDSASCLACTPGQYQPESRMTSCEMCGLGYFGNISELLNCHLCPPGTHQDMLGQASCMPCIRKFFFVLLFLVECVVECHVVQKRTHNLSTLV